MCYQCRYSLDTYHKYIFVEPWGGGDVLSPVIDLLPAPDSRLERQSDLHKQSRHNYPDFCVGPNGVLSARLGFEY